MSIESVMLSNYLILCHSFSFCLQSFPASGSFPMNQLFTSGGQSLGASASVPFSEYSGLISFRIDWFDLSYYRWLGFPCGLAGKESACNVGHLGLIPGLQRSPGEGKGYPLQCFGLENFMDCIVHGVTESDTTEQLSLLKLAGGRPLRQPGCTAETPGSRWLLPNIALHVCPSHPRVVGRRTPARRGQAPSSGR